MHSYSSSPIVVATSQYVIVQACKIMLYPEPKNLTNPTSYFRTPSVPVEIGDVIIPVYPAVGDIVKVSGDDGSTWIVHVVAVNQHAKTCQVNFYVNTSNTNDVYVRESTGHRAREVVHWSSLLDVASGNYY